MDILNHDVDKLIKAKAKEIYQNVCTEIVEKNGLKTIALGICDQLCEMHIADEKDKDPLFSYEKTWKDIKRDIRALAEG